MSTRVTIDFLVAGFSKCGTTTLCAALGKHPDVFIPVVKEPRYFSSPEFDTSHGRYNKLFAAARPGQKKGEGSPSYSSARGEDLAIPRIRANNPDCRLLFIARDPRKRIESSYREMQHSGMRFGFNAPFELHACLTRFPHMIDDSLFCFRIQKYLDAFGEDAVHVMFLEDFRQDMAAQLRRCCEHIGVDPGQLPNLDDLQLNAGSAKLYDGPLLRHLRTHRVFGPQIAKLSPAAQDRLFAPLGLRRAFGSQPVEWDAPSEAIFRERVVPSARRFLEHFGRSPGFWNLPD